MYEVELKVSADLAAVEARLNELDAEVREAVVQADIYYDAPHRDFAQTDEAFRLRRETRVDADDGDAEETDATAKLTYKGPLVEAESKTREEFETTVGDGETAESIFESLGFDPAAVVRKDRRFYALDGFLVTLDDVEDVGTFVEIETEVETEAEVQAAREAAIELLERLGLDPEARTQASYLGMLLSEDNP